MFRGKAKFIENTDNGYARAREGKNESEKRIKVKAVYRFSPMGFKGIVRIKLVHNFISNSQLISVA